MSCEKTISRRYAKALLGALVEAKNEEISNQVKSSLKTFSGYMADENSEFFKIMTYPGFSEEDRIGLIKKVSAESSFPELAVNFLSLLVKKMRIDLLREIFASFEKEQDRIHARVHATITSAVVLNGEELHAVVSGLKHKVKKDIIPNVVVDKRALGGIRANVDGMVFDSTLQSQLNKLKMQVETASF